MPAFKMNTIEKESSFYNSNTNSNNAIITYRDFVEQNQKQKTLFDIVKLNMQIYKSQISVAIAFFIFISSSVACQYIFKGNAPYFAIPFLVCLFAIAFNGIYSLIVFTIITMTTDPDLTDYQKIDRELRLSKKFYARMYTIRNFLNFFF